jgi:hypothetical protein
MASFETQFDNLVKSWHLDINDVKIVSHLCSFHEVMRAIYQRNDTQQYIYIERGDSYRDGVDDYFKWHYITEKEKNEEIAKCKKYKL